MHQREYVLHVAASPAENRPLFLFLRPSFPPRITNWFPSRLFSAILMLARTLKSDSTLNSGGAQTQTLLSRTNRTSVKFSEKPLNVNNLIRKSPRIFKLMAQLYLLEGWVVATACIFSSVQAIDMFSILWIKYGFMRLVNHFILFLFTQHPNVLCKCARTNLQSSFFFLFTLSVSFLLTFSLC